MLNISRKIFSKSIYKSLAKKSVKTTQNFCTKIDTSGSVKNFYHDKNVFITGGTGYLGKLLVEKLLRSCPEVNTIYLLIRPKKGSDIKQRLNAIFDSQAFDLVKQENPGVLEKVIGISGDIASPGLGINESDLRRIIQDVSVVFHSAASISLETKLNNFAEIVTTNVGGTKNVLELCHKLQNDNKILVHLSSSYCNWHREGEEIKELVYAMKETPGQILEIIKDNNEVKALVSKLSKVHKVAYNYAKAQAEYLLLMERKGLTIAIVRPSLVGPTWKEPYIGWSENPISVHGLFSLFGKGVIRQWCGNPNVKMDWVPADTAINCTIAAAWYTSSRKIIHDIRSIFVHLIPAFCLDSILRLKGKQPFMVTTQIRARKLLDNMSYYTKRQTNYDNSKMLEMWDAMSEEDKKEFYFDIREMHWPDFMENYILGFKRYFFKEDISGLPDARKNLQKKYNNYVRFRLAAYTTVLCCSIAPFYNLF